MKVVRNDILPFKGYKAVNIMGVLFVRKGATLSETDISHEEIHTEQMKELLYVGFYLWYAVEWAVKLLAHRFDGHTAYRNVGFEREAYEHQADADYVKTRKRYAWVRLIRN